MSDSSFSVGTGEGQESRWRVEVSTTYYDVVEVTATTAKEARERACARPISTGVTFCEVESHQVFRLDPAPSFPGREER
jgi:hypothetical protein